MPLDERIVLKPTAYILGQCISLPSGQLNAANAADLQCAVCVPRASAISPFASSPGRNVA
jgi:hypothetical protein